MAIQAARNLGKGPAVNLDQMRVGTARRYIFEKEHMICFVGDGSVGVKGILDSTYYGAGLGTMEDVASGTVDTEWSTKTPNEIIEDLNKGIGVVEAQGLFKARVLVLPNTQWNLLKKPYSTQSPMTTLKWLETEGVYFEKIIVTNAMSQAYNGIAGPKDAFLILDNEREIVDLATLMDITLGDAVFDFLGTSNQVVKLKTGGLIVRHPSALYVGTAI